MKQPQLDAVGFSILCIGITRDERRAMGAQWVERMQGIAAEHGWKL